MRSAKTALMAAVLVLSPLSTASAMTTSECASNAFWNQNMWVFGLTGYALAYAACRNTPR